ncbi:DUF3159 domain-containing protein [Allokutzneria albata]|uniref:DUF3159 domain-containing protein n=1 Tax=Allokutzneria albata TaxID=211114 RepID=A0A1G9WUK4_ALLAB|nr:DUF3159 domain-containing protein [Allokutzneria albata]SDM87815.1 Protein of unknown function [Allokutzneria albata]
MTEPTQTPESAEKAGRAEPTLLEQMGGLAGLISSTIPVVAFVTINSLAGLQPAIWGALGVAALIAVWRLVRKEALQPAVSGFLGVGICVFIANQTGEAKGFFLFGIWASLVYGGVFLVSVLARWPLVGVIWSTLNDTGFAWRQDKSARLAYDIATLSWVLVFGARFVVQRYLYNADETGWLAVARLSMGWPLTILVGLVTVWAVRRVGRIEKSHAQASSPATA